ncbi:hypothetical protein QBC33DRAFT_594261 [Phialemonium atrogriseum]|uniref:Uncharacterized protein n=1 Tax=Phialemonium atrogriseum TaxID=1093897 RepID=A0AAJ0BX64_9PEZI|nr:uncharacterized protein QBC33DRAFT_594261 [Phialemonium atrogriseum]KAK1764764.1 hypothetical protein QBC33DRAFT_594261 [Phialemonium atrogriseum]
MLLSTECQKRGFNPQWTAGEMRGGMFQCSVNLNGREIGPGPAFFATFEEAKREMASKALDIVKTWPVTKAPKPATQNVQTATQPPMQPATQSRARGQDLAGLLKSVQKSNASLRQGKRKAKQAKAAKAANSGNGSRTGHVARATAGEHANLQKIKQEEGVEQRLKVPKIVKDSGTTGHAAKGNGREKTSGEKTSRVLEEVQSLIGTTFPDNFNEDPRIATTFLEGLALGSRLAESVAKNSQLRDGSQAHDQTGRSPNRDALRLRSYRSRSPVRGRDRESDRRWRDHGEQRRSSYYRPYQDHHSPRRHSRRTRSRSPAESRTYQDHHRRDSFASSDVASRGTDRGVARRVERGVEPSRTTASGPSVPPKSQGKTKDLRQGSGLQY